MCCGVSFSFWSVTLHPHYSIRLVKAMVKYITATITLESLRLICKCHLVHGDVQHGRRLDHTHHDKPLSHGEELDL